LRYLRHPRDLSEQAGPRPVTNQGHGKLRQRDPARTYDIQAARLVGRSLRSSIPSTIVRRTVLLNRSGPVSAVSRSVQGDPWAIVRRLQGCAVAGHSADALSGQRPRGFDLPSAGRIETITRIGAAAHSNRSPRTGSDPDRPRLGAGVEDVLFHQIVVVPDHFQIRLSL